MQTRRDSLLALAVFFLALAWVVVFSGGSPAYEPDSTSALHIAQNIAAGEGIVQKVAHLDGSPLEPSPTITKPPLFHVGVAGLISLGISAKNAGYIVSMTGFVAAVTLLFLLARQVLPPLPALVAPLLFALQVTSLRWGITVHEETLFIALAYATIWRLTALTGRFGEAGWGEHALVGVLAGLAMLASYQGLPVLIVATLFMAVLAWQLRRALPLLAYTGGLAVVGAWPFLRFVWLWLQGVRPGFDISGGSAYYKLLAGIASAFQNDFAGRQLVWLYDGSMSDMAIVCAFFLLLALLLVHAWRQPRLRPLATFVAVYVAMLVLQLGRMGFEFYTSRYSMPFNGPVLLFLVFALYELQRRWPSLHLPAAGGGLLAVAVLAYGQINRYPDLLKGHDELCPAPATMEWVRSHIPAGAAIASGQCGYQLLADSSAHFWVPIPPARDVHNPKRWTEDDLARVCEKSPAPWIVLFEWQDGRQIDPFRKEPGYGTYISALFDDQASARTELMARLDDGLVYRIKCDTP